MMKRILSFLLLVCLLLSGCSFGRDQSNEPVIFYYLRQYDGQDGYDLFFSDGAIGAETRDISGHRNDLNYLLTLYMQGPADSDLQFPFPIGSKVLETRLDNGKLTVTMNAITSRFNEMDVTVSCACIAKTCMEITDVTEVTVEAYGPNGNILFSRTFTDENLILEDSEPLPSEEAEESE